MVCFQAYEPRTQFTQAETHAQIVRTKPERSMFILIHKPTQSHTQTVDFRSMPEKNQWMVGVARRGWLKKSLTAEIYLER